MFQFTFFVVATSIFRSLRDTLAPSSSAKVACQPAELKKYPLIAAGRLPNKEDFGYAFATSVMLAETDKSHLSVMHVGLENLLLVQDGFGEMVKDEVVKQVAERLQHIAGTEGKVAVDTEGKFLLLVRGNGAVSVPLAKRALLAMVQAIEVNGYQHKTRCSVGIAVYPEHGTHSQILSRAALALRIARERGGDQVCLYAAEMSALVRDQAILVHDLSQAIANGELILYFQPKIDAASMQVTSAEALLRWRHPTRGFVSPMEFIPLAEKYGLMEGIGGWVFEEACINAAAWLRSGLRMRVAVNISSYQMHQDDLVTQILSTLDRYGLAPARFTCEITETAAMEDTHATRVTFDKMREAGLHVSIDDFGTGYSSLAALRRLPAAELKIDMAFVKDLESSKEARSIAKSIIDMAKALGLHVVAEGVETAGQSDLLVGMGCDDLQGYLFSLPIPADELLRMAKNPVQAGASEFRNSLFATDFVELKAASGAMVSTAMS
jgi:diguanylate cyclase (GGDEF)-like protein